MNLYIDASLSGISGDMLLALLIGLGGDETLLKDLSHDVSKLLGSEQEIIIRDVERKGIIAKNVGIKIKKDVKIDKNKFEYVINSLDLKDEIRIRAKKIFETILNAERKIHGHENLHEIASVDTIIDIIGFLLLLDDLKIENVFCSIIETGKGKIKTSHGYIFIPAPITLEILKTYKIPFKSEIEGYELATPTGVAIIANVSKFENIGEIVAENVSYAAGSYDLEEVPNIARGILFTKKFKKEYISIIETNLDDVSGEIIGYLFEKLYKEGALDFHVIQCLGKKSRPCFILRVITNPSNEDRICNILFKETGTLGIRIFKCEKRAILDREIKEIEIFGEKVRIKISRDFHGNVINVKPEYSDMKNISEKYNIPLKDLYNIILKRI